MTQKVMVDQEVENILAEIRERVRAQELPRVIANPPQTNGAGEPPIPLEASGEVCPPSAETLARIDSYLTVTSRAWSRLPPLASNRSGTIAQLELWLKRLIKRATHWFTWEQINFNAAVHHSLQEIDQALSAYQHALEGLRAEAEGKRAMLEQGQLALIAQREEFETQLAQLETQLAELETQLAELETRRSTQWAQLEAQRVAQVAELEAQRVAQLTVQRKEIDAQFSEISQVMQTRLEHLQEEQRVCFKQLSLEATEAAVLEDRARRKSEKLLEELRGRIDQLEKQ